MRLRPFAAFVPRGLASRRRQLALEGWQTDAQRLRCSPVVAGGDGQGMRDGRLPGRLCGPS